MYRRWSEAGLEIPLLGGGTVVLRLLTPADGLALARGHAQLSTRSRYLRYHSLVSGPLTQAEIAHLTDVDQRDRAAWVLEMDGKGIAVGRYIRLGPFSDMAEVALAILDPWQRRGISKLLLAALMRTARRASIERLTAFVLEENIAAMRLLWSLGAEPRLTESGERWAELGTDPAGLPPTPAAVALQHYAHLVAGRLD